MDWGLKRFLAPLDVAVPDPLPSIENDDIRRKPVMSKGLKADLEKCTGCQMCAIVCSAHHTGKFNPSESRINVMDLFPEPGEVKLNYCIHCDEHPCVEACPAEAIRLNEELGIYYVDKEECTGCGECVEACPYDGCWMDPSESYSIKCDLCGGTPQCVETCPKGVLSRGDQ